MPSPIGHALAGVAIAWTAASADQPEGTSSTPSLPWPRKLPWICATLAVLPDIDLLYLPLHRTVTHSVTAVVVVIIVAAGVTGWVTGRVSAKLAALCGIAYASHLLMDWFGADASVPYGIQLFWPFSDRWFVSPFPIFPGTERRDPFGTRAILINLRAAATELAIGGGVLWLVWIRRRRKSRAPTSVPAGQRPPSA